MRQFTNVPGYDTVVRDGQLRVAVTAPLTGNITLIDYGLWGKVNTPRQFYNLDDARQVHGKVTGAFGRSDYVAGFNRNALVRAIEEIVTAGCRNFTTVRLDFGGATASTLVMFDPKDGTSSNKALNTDSTELTLTFGTLPAGVTLNNAGWAPAVAASATISVAVGKPSDADTVTVNGRAYTWKSALSTGPAVAYEVLIGADNAACAANLAAAINGAAGAGTTYGTGTVAHTTVSASVQTNVVTVTAKTAGAAGSDYTLTRSGTNVTVSGAKFSGGVDGVAIGTVTDINVSDKKITLSYDTAFASAPDNTSWKFSKGVLFTAPCPGAAGNSLTLGVENIGTEQDPVKRLNIQAPAELGGRLSRFSSGRYARLSDLAFAVNTTLPELFEVQYLYGATGEELFSEFPTFAVTALGVAPTGVSSFVVVGTNAAIDPVSGLEMDPFQPNITPALKRKWYAAALGSCLRDELRDCALPLLRGTPTGVVVVPSILLDDLTTADGGIATTQYNVQDTEGNWSVASYPSQSDNILQWLLDFVHLQNRAGFMTDLVMGVSALANPNLVAIRNRVEYLQNVIFMDGSLTNGDGESDPVDAGAYLSVFAGPQRVALSPEIGHYLTSGALQYAALMVTTSAASSPSQEPLPGGTVAAYEFRIDQINTLAGGQGANGDGGAYVVSDTSKRPDVINMAVTAAGRKSDYAKFHNRRVMEAAVMAVRGATSGYLGKPFGMSQRMSMSTDIHTALETLYDQGVLFGGKEVGYRYSIAQSASDGILGSVTIFLEVKPNPELDWINEYVQMFN